MPQLPPKNASNTAGFQLDPMIDDVEEVLLIRAAAISAYKQGRQILEWGGEGTEVKKQWVAPVSEVLAETRRFLKLFDPDTYGHIVRQSNMLRTG